MIKTYTFTLEPFDNHRLNLLCGQNHGTIKKIEQFFDVKIKNRSNQFQILGDDADIDSVSHLIHKLFNLTANGPIEPHQIDLLMNCPTSMDATIKSKYPIKLLNRQQLNFLEAIDSHDISFGIGPSGTGKTYLAVAAAVFALKNKLCKKIILVRPAIEAGEKVGYLPGDMAEKINPYLQPLYDSLYELMGVEQVNKAIENKIIEINLLAFMRGRTFKNSFVIIDEAQNCTSSQMKMALTRIGYASKMVIVGDCTQSDLPKKESGLDKAIETLRGINQISKTEFDSSSVVRHPLVQKIVQAYEEKDNRS